MSFLPLPLHPHKLFILSFILSVSFAMGLPLRQKTLTIKLDHRLINTLVRQSENSIFSFFKTCVCICLYTLHCSFFFITTYCISLLLCPFCTMLMCMSSQISVLSVTVSQVALDVWKGQQKKSHLFTASEG